MYVGGGGGGWRYEGDSLGGGGMRVLTLACVIATGDRGKRRCRQ